MTILGDLKGALLALDRLTNVEQALAADASRNRVLLDRLAADVRDLRERVIRIEALLEALPATVTARAEAAAMQTVLHTAKPPGRPRRSIAPPVAPTSED